ncbi:MAG: SDR family NAD(P)-dependent oxidoreductase [Burkholderiales bacterium]
MTEFADLQLAPPKGTTFLVVGGCGGIGRVLVKAALDAELDVAVMDLERTMALHPVPTGARSIRIDATDEQAVTRAFDELKRSWSGLGALVNLAGFTNDQVPVDQVPAAEFDSIVAGSLRSTYLVAHAAVPMMKASGGGAIVHTASGLASNVRPGFGAYGAAKAGVIALTKAIARESGPTIRANCIAPGAVDTEFLKGGTGREAHEQRLDWAAYTKMIPLGRLAEPLDVVGPILFLAGPASRYMSGQVLWINGGALTP